MTTLAATTARWAFAMRPIPANVTSSCRECGRPGRVWHEADDGGAPVALCASHAHATALELVERVRTLGAS